MANGTNDQNQAGQSEEAPKAYAQGSKTEGAHHHRCDCPPGHYCGRCGPPRYWDPYCPPPWWRHHHHHRHQWSPGSDFFEAMLDFAASSAGFRGGFWRQMADAARYARRDVAWDPYCDPCPPRYSYCDPSEPPSRGRRPWPPKDWCEPCDPCWPPRDSCDPCEPRRECCGADEIDLKQVSTWLTDAAKEAADGDAEAQAKYDAEIQAVLHAVRMMRAAEAARQKKWSRQRRW